MKTIIALLFFATVSIQAQSIASEEASKTEILKLSNDWSMAIINRDSQVLENVLAPDFTLNGSLPRNIWMDNTLHHIKTSELKMIQEPKITVYDDMVVCEAIWHFKASFDEKIKIDGDYLITDIWKKNSGSWQVIIRLSKENK
ncbi:hypothetical protein FLJC2902T_22410 [Flavobacterium limnosediminis JC2902]|uniref:DUF4440 domain-containing protein n=1 Tax=Flavobacterium limnosediminis JC2902 TaxID=1341181 RepID=V6SLJ8_9FLAO|nr:nuclear transport factor 2 family protein [Flavobacterium limnosediminis]ESU27132.1 hypothetical protein FLJC2902T_22410 [Flavobacterium limnosediminis JC2902]